MVRSRTRKWMGSGLWFLSREHARGYRRNHAPDLVIEGDDMFLNPGDDVAQQYRLSYLVSSLDHGYSRAP